MLGLFGLNVALGAFLLFQVQPLLAKYILPWFGGAPAVWTWCMLFFQIGLVAGYGYAHGLTSLCTPRRQVVIHAMLVGTSLLLLPIIPDPGLIPDSESNPTLRILQVMGTSVGLQYFLVASTAPLMQAWFHMLFPRKSPYPLYALSNTASLIALISYPFVVEPNFGRELQATMWSWMFSGFAVTVVWLGTVVWRKGSSSRVSSPQDTGAPVSRSARGLWLLWSAVGSVLLLAVTNEITQDVAVVPFFWVLPLSLYLLTFVTAFGRESWYRRRWMVPLLVPAISGMVWMMYRAGTAPVIPLITAFMFGLWTCCTICHGELSRLKPDPGRLTGYYLIIAVGGALGGVFTAVVAPLLFTTFFELHLGILACIALLLLTVARDTRSRLYGLRPRWAWALLAIAYAATSFMLTHHVALSRNAAIAKTRNFFGVLTVLVVDRGRDSEHVVLRNGMIDHGAQLTSSGKSGLPTTYYGFESGLGIGLQRAGSDGGRRVGVVGLGIGTVAAYGRRNDVFRFYEINPSVTRFAREYFTYLEDSAAEIQVVHGDGRLSLEQEGDQAFDILVLDAFSGDAIPVHLLTREAFSVYLRHLAPNGVLLVNISNRHANLAPVVARHAEHFQMRYVLISNGPAANAVWSADWMILSKNAELFNDVVIGAAREIGDLPDSRAEWTDDHADILAAIRSLW